MNKDIEPGASIHFVYIDSKNKVTEQKSTLLSHKDHKFFAKCLTHGHLKCFLYESVLFDLTNYKDNLSALLLHYQGFYTEYVPVRRGPRDPSTLNIASKPEIQFTGFYSVLKMNQIKTKQELMDIAESKGFFIKKSKKIGLNVSILVCGHNAGPKKMIEASSRGSILLNEKQFLHMIENGGELLDEG
jgi:hypothetical protein